MAVVASLIAVALPFALLWRILERKPTLSGDMDEARSWLAAPRKLQRTTAPAATWRPSVPPTPSWSPTIRRLAEAVLDGDDCAYALHDALLESGHDELARELQIPDARAEEIAKRVLRPI